MSGRKLTERMKLQRNVFCYPQNDGYSNEVFMLDLVN